jgi:hypothetical protein
MSFVQPFLHQVDDTLGDEKHFLPTKAHVRNTFDGIVKIAYSFTSSIIHIQTFFFQIYICACARTDVKDNEWCL